jgi:predicted porin
MRLLITYVVFLVFCAASGLLGQTQESADKTGVSAAVGATKEEVGQLRSEVAAQRQTIEELKTLVQQLTVANRRESEGGSVVPANARGDGTPHLMNTSLVESPEPRMVGFMEQAIEDKSSSAAKKPPKPSDNMEWTFGGTTVQVYGHTDVSYDYVDNGITAAMEAGVVPGFNPPNDPRRANNGWLGQVSSNLSYFGVRGSHKISDNLTGVFQFETEVSFGATPGATSDNQCKYCLGSRDSFVGVRGPWGSVKIGKEDAPYKRVIVPLDPFYNTLGDHRSIMGNSGGDNRAEFETRISHAIWYESPTWKGLYASILFAPGQNRSADNGAYPRAEPICAGGNGIFVSSNQNRANVAEAVDSGDINPCNDGSWGNVTSAALSYKNHGFYGFAAYEHHGAVNRTVDFVGVSDEAGWRFGVSYTVAQTGTTGSFIYEGLKRYAANSISAVDGQPVKFGALDERTRPLATMVVLSQKAGKKDMFSVDWIHAGKTPGDPGQCAGTDANGACNSFVSLTGVPGTADSLINQVNNQSNMYAAGFRHTLTKNMSTYFVYARQANHAFAHYDLGAVGHGSVVDKRDFTGTGIVGTRLQGVSGGMTFDF